uniref:Uncharacterized protein n=1 Tax=Panagrolaimus sp. JU765 TaxID=591449 RepID=A0AC34R7S7_9BILA
MRQCKRCGLYQYITGCIRLTEWQLRDLQISRQKAELLNTRAGAAMLCEDNANHPCYVKITPIIPPAFAIGEIGESRHF